MLSIGIGWVWADEQTKEQAGDVQERALPGMTIPRVAPGATLAPKPKGSRIQGDRLKAAPGTSWKKDPIIQCLCGEQQEAQVRAIGLVHAKVEQGPATEARLEILQSARRIQAMCATARVSGNWG
jgi:hypothetical protein